jgi:hypothetical protein
MGGATGFEAEIVLPKKDGRRLWAGILSRDTVALKFMVAHPAADREWFEPAVTGILRSLRFLDRATGVPVHPSGMPLPNDAREIDPSLALLDPSGLEGWTVFETPHSMAGLQAFYWREAPAHGWQIDHFEPYLGTGDTGLARASMQREGQRIALGLVPSRGETSSRPWLGRIAFKTVRGT